MGITLGGGISRGQHAAIAHFGVDHGAVGADPITSALGPGALERLLEYLTRKGGRWWFNEHWLPTGMVVNVLGGTGAILWSGYHIVLNTEATINSYVRINKEMWGLENVTTWEKRTLVSLLAKFRDNTDQYVHLVTGSLTHDASANIVRHLGFKVIDGTLYATVGDGAAESTLSLGAVDTGAYVTLELYFTPGVECRFYKNGVDQGAITTNLPTGTTSAEYVMYASVYNTAAVKKELELLAFRFYQEE